MGNCKYCDIVSNKSLATFVHREEYVSVFMDIQPINTGHLLVVPNAHASYLADLDPDTGAQMFRVAQEMAQSLRCSGLKCEGVNLFLADGKAAMQDVFHVHLHVIPRFNGDGFGLTLPDDYSKKPSRSEIELAAEGIRNALLR